VERRTTVAGPTSSNSAHVCIDERAEWITFRITVNVGEQLAIRCLTFRSDSEA
jgi:hypothetical protein